MASSEHHTDSRKQARRDTLSRYYEKLVSLSIRRKFSKYKTDDSTPSHKDILQQKARDRQAK